MKKQGMLNSDIAKVISDMGHTDTIVIADCGLPIPDGVKKIDLALKLGTPSFLDVLNELEKELMIESVTLATEIKTDNEPLFLAIKDKFSDCSYVSHETFKKKTEKAKAIIRTGEASPYANIILTSGVIF
ncbi:MULTISPECIES: D-ribose pyranase [Cytobacillus]|uniref:D-ribose pyranase n=1 Tax=Cytobacillus TaxID=2675230 RepID=UPI001CD1994F|nr:D-ribose pyranase [Cytobacillus kochii]MCA1027305.1 D-ribose pyranase [Cytobacillus kochii]MCM3320969.1 D-ribose pyranase [Cytobacillus kochii]MCM3344198.1 D-ribose pyranase [Cytobacillus kochii]